MIHIAKTGVNLKHELFKLILILIENSKATCLTKVVLGLG